MKVVCAFPTCGKTYLVRHLEEEDKKSIDFDYGKVRDMFGLSFSDEKGRGSNVISTFYRLCLEAARDAQIDFVFTNEPHIQYNKNMYEVIFVVPNFTVNEWYERVVARGDDPNADWVQFIRTNFDKCVKDWSDLAKNRGFKLITLESGEHLSDKMEAL